MSIMSITLPSACHNGAQQQHSCIFLKCFQFNFPRLEEISGAASKEYSLEKAMEKMKIEWAEVHFEFSPYRDTVSK